MAKVFLLETLCRPVAESKYKNENNNNVLRLFGYYTFREILL